VLDEVVSAGLLAAVALSALLFIRTGDVESLLPRSLMIAAGFGVVMTFVLSLLRRPRGNQTSYCQPVRIRRVRRARGNQIAEILLGFTSDQFLSQFRALNARLVAAGRVVVQLER
jgi:hypothetical protein